LFLKLLNSEHQNVCEQAVWALGNIIGERWAFWQLCTACWLFCFYNASCPLFANRRRTCLERLRHQSWSGTTVVNVH